MEGLNVLRMGIWVVLVLCVTWVTCLVGQNAPYGSVFFSCNNTFVSVSVKRDPLALGVMLDPGSLTLGKCPVSSTNDLYDYYVFEYNINTCGFSRMVFGNLIKYFVNLVYQPTTVGASQVYQPFTSEIRCIFNKSFTPTPIEATVVVPVYGMGQLMFSGRLMQDDFSGASNVKDFMLGSPVSLELSVETAVHMPLQILVDECIVTPTPEITSTGPSYSLITNHGCFVDGKVAASKFVEYSLLDTIRLTFPAMRFVDDSNKIYLHFKVVVGDPESVTERRKACSFISNRWQLLGNSQSTVCNCCDSVCNKNSRRKRNVEEHHSITHTMVLGPFKVHGTSMEENSAANKSKVVETNSGFVLPPVVGGLFLELAVLLLLSVGVALYDRTTKKNWENTEKRLLVSQEN